MKRIVFAGPSLFGADLAAFGDLEFRPPASAGDVLVAMQDQAEAIGLIDGVFEGFPSVWHKEILAVINAGVTVFGAASMGALRAAECHHYGMIGVGRIFGDYHTGQRRADADVAVQHAPAELGYRPLTLALADMEATIEHLLAERLIHPTRADALLEAARTLGFRERNWETIVARVAPEAGAVEFVALLRAHERSQKQEDALDLLRAIQNWDDRQQTGWRVKGEAFNRTDVFLALKRRVTQRQRRA